MKNSILKRVDTRQYMMVIALVCIWVIFTILSSGTFFEPRNMSNLFRQSVFTGILALGMMIRYLFVFGIIYRRVTDALKTRLFDPFDHRLPYRYRIVNMGYMMGSMFIRSLEQGERTYASMLCRGYGRDSFIFIRDKPLLWSDMMFLCLSLCVIILVPLLCWYDPFSLMSRFEFLPYSA